MKILKYLLFKIIIPTCVVLFAVGLAMTVINAILYGIH